MLKLTLRETRVVFSRGEGGRGVAGARVGGDARATGGEEA